MGNGLEGFRGTRREDRGGESRGRYEGTYVQSVRQTRHRACRTHEPILSNPISTYIK